MTRIMNSDGFTLFTALVAFILIVLAMLLIQSMISTERSVSDVITDISSQEEMQAIADLSRADALQVFNYNVRYSIEEFSTKDTENKGVKPDNPYYIFACDPHEWDAMQNEFVLDRFGVRVKNATGNNATATTQFAGLAARHLISLLQKVPDSRGYRIDLAYPQQGNNSAAESEMTGILQKTFESQAGKGGNDGFFQVIKCDAGDYKNCVGTFYVTLDLSPEAMDAATYEKFPLVQVEEIQTGRVIKEAILPRGRFRLYVPVRLFKALAGAKEIGFSNGAGILQPDIGAAMAAKTTKAEMDDILKQGMAKLMAKTALNVDNDSFGLCLDCTADKSGYEVDAHTEKAEAALGSNETPPEKLVDYEVRLYFEEKNNQYKVSKQGRNRFAVILKKFMNQNC